MKKTNSIVTKDMLKEASKTIISKNKTLNYIIENINVKEDVVLNGPYEKNKFELGTIK